MFYLAIILTGGLGALLRYFLGRVMTGVSFSALPFATLIANVLGCFLMGYLSWMLIHKFGASEQAQVVVLTGFLGGFTTFSAFSLEVINLLEQGADVRAMVYITLSVTLCIAMCFLGLMLARQTS